MSKNQIEVTLIDSMGSDLSIVNAARVSFGKKSEWDKAILSHQELEESGADYNDWEMFESFYEPYTGYELRKLKDQDVRLLKYLAKHKHMSPFGHVFLSFHVKAPIFVARQLVKHKFLRWNEISRRYVDDEPEFYTPDVWRGRSEDKKQGSEGEVNPEFNPQYLDSKIKAAYFKALEFGVAPEQARMLLPQSTMTEWYWSGSLDAFTDMCKLRLGSDTQLETQYVAQGVYDKLKERFPVSAPLLVEGVY